MSSSRKLWPGLLWPVLILVASMAVNAARVAAFHPDKLTLDEDRYLRCAELICEGVLVRDDNPDFVNGPGYPAALAPFVKAGLPLYWARLVNGAWLGLGCVFLYLTVRHYANTTWAVVAAFWTMLQPSMLRLTPFLMSEAFMMGCVGWFVWAWCRALRAESRVFWHGLHAALALWAMVMTRVMFGHVTTTVLLLALLAWPWMKALRRPVGRAVLITGLGLLMCLPYLAYTKAKTGKTWCWSTNSGELLYWVTSCHPGENGFWFSVADALHHPDLAPHHREFFLKVTQLPVMEREAAFTAKAMENLRTAPPERLAYNWLCNLCRMAFGFPRAFMAEELSRGVMVAFHTPFLLLVFGATLVWLRRPGSIPPEVSLLGLVALVYLAGSTLPPALLRYAMVATPMLWVGVSYIFYHHVEVRLTPGATTSQSGGKWCQGRG